MHLRRDKTTTGVVEHIGPMNESGVAPVAVAYVVNGTTWSVSTDLPAANLRIGQEVEVEYDASEPQSCSDIRWDAGSPPACVRSRYSALKFVREVISEILSSGEVILCAVLAALVLLLRHFASGDATLNRYFLCILAAAMAITFFALNGIARARIRRSPSMATFRSIKINTVAGVLCLVVAFFALFVGINNTPAAPTPDPINSSADVQHMLADPPGQGGNETAQRSPGAPRQLSARDNAKQ
jgi:hypothetical protein